MKNLTKKLVPIIALVVVLVLALGAISSINRKNDTSEYFNPTTETVRISLDEFIGWKPLIYANGGLITTTNSINAKNGIKIEYVIENDARVSSDALISGELQGSGYTINRLSFLQSKFDEAGIKVIMPYVTNYSNGGDGIICSAEIRSVNDLIDKKIAVPKYSEAQTLVEWLIRNSSFTNTEIAQIRNNMVFFDTADETANAYFAGTVDAAATWEPYLTQAASSTNSRILFDTSMGTNLVMDGLVFSKNFAESHENFIVKLIDGALEANATYLTEVDSIKVMDTFKLMEDHEIREMCEYASVATWADNMSILTSTCPTVYQNMANIWKSIGEKADPDKAEEVFTDKYVAKLKGKYSEKDITSFAFSEEGRKAAEQVANHASLISMTLDIKFQTDDYKLDPSSGEALREFAEVAKLLNGCYIQIEGNTAKVEGDDGVEFSYKRALSVAKYLQALGIDSGRFIVIGNGDKNPIASNSTEEGKEQNRRVEVFFKQIGY